MISVIHDAPDPAKPLLAALGMPLAARSVVPAFQVDMLVWPGDLQIVHTRDKDSSGDIADGLLGLGTAGGDVRYLGRAWRELNPAAALNLRRGVGRVQSGGNWMETRSVMENLLLPVLHHTILPERQLRQGASELARRFGLPGLPTSLPGECTTADLERAACVRAFLGHPTLVILEHPMKFEDASLLAPMMNAIQQVRWRQGAVIWFTEHLAHLRDASIPADRRCLLAGTRLREVES